MNASGWDPAQVRKARAEKAEAERREMAAILVVLDPKTAQKMAHACLEVLRSVLAKQVADKSRPPAGAGPVTLGTPRALPVRATVGRSAAPSSTPQGAEMDRRMGIRPGGLAIVDEGSRLVFRNHEAGERARRPCGPSGARHGCDDLAVVDASGRGDGPPHGDPSRRPGHRR
ncbi:MAG: hypothetical protein IPF92_13095 [Myxococcales bacterium]|nr:hypothetical protein [Myxococcales bacterium]